jgi:hypothetical protein
MSHRPGEPVTESGIYWCTVCKTPAQFTASQTFPECPNLCGRGLWKLVESAKSEPQSA